MWTQAEDATEKKGFFLFRLMTAASYLLRLKNSETVFPRVFPDIKILNSAF